MDFKTTIQNHPTTAEWHSTLERIDVPSGTFTLPSAEELPAVLLDLAVPHEDIETVVGLLVTLDATPDARWVLERTAQGLLQQVGSIERPTSIPHLPEELGIFGRYFFVFVFVAMLPHVRAFHQERGIDPDVSRRTLADLGRNMAVYRRRHGMGGLHAPGWMMHHFTGNLYELGRLQFERQRLGTRTGEALRQAGLPFGPGDPVLSVHIPAFYGPLSPAACDASFARARGFFARHFPETPYEIATCHSWLLDDQLAQYLPAHSNIVQFGQRFRPAYVPDFDSRDTLLFVFGKAEPDIDALPQRTYLERIIVEHIRAGKHWRIGVGWTTLP